MQAGERSISELVDDITYSAYKFNRDMNPHVPPEGWTCVFGRDQARKMERRYQESLTPKERANLADWELAKHESRVGRRAWARDAE